MLPNIQVYLSSLTYVAILYIMRTRLNLNSKNKLIELCNLIQAFTVYIRLLYLEKNAEYAKRCRDKLKKQRVELDSTIIKISSLPIVLIDNKEKQSLDPNLTRYNIYFTW